RTLRAPDGFALEEHRFVPVSPEAPEGAGWLLGTAYDHKRRQSALTIFDTRSASSDPVAVARMERRIPFGFHGWFVSD
ncbi:MAG: carotenoid oxygenase family protein, partial [Myxococcota bacterium]